MTENNLSNTDVKVSTSADNCATAKLEKSPNIQFLTSISLGLPNQLRTNATQKEISVRITSKNRVFATSEIKTF